MQLRPESAAPSYVPDGTPSLPSSPADVLDFAYAQRLDEQDPLAPLRDQFVVGEPDLIYLGLATAGRA